MGTLRVFRSEPVWRFPFRVSRGGSASLLARRSVRSCVAALSVVAARGLKASTPGGSLKAEAGALFDCAVGGVVSWRRRSFLCVDRAGDLEAVVDGAQRRRRVLVMAAGGRPWPLKLPSAWADGSVGGMAPAIASSEMEAARVWPVMVAAVLRRGAGPSQIWVGAKAFGPGSWLYSDGPSGFGPRFAVTGPMKGFGMQ